MFAIRHEDDRPTESLLAIPDSLIPNALNADLLAQEFLKKPTTSRFDDHVSKIVTALILVLTTPEIG